MNNAFGVSSFTFLTIMFCGAAMRVIAVLDLPLWLKLFSIALLLLVSYMVFAYDNEMAVLESMKH